MSQIILTGKLFMSNMMNVDEIFSVFTIICALACAVIVTRWTIIFYNHQHHPLLIKRKSNLTIFTCLMTVFAEIFLVMFVINYSNLAFLSKSTQLYAGLLFYLLAPCSMYGIGCAYVLRYVRI